MLTDDKLKEKPYSVPSKVLLPEHKQAEELQCTFWYQFTKSVELCLRNEYHFPPEDIPSVNALMMVMQSAV